MADDVAVLDAVETPVNTETSIEEPTQSTDKIEPDKQDGRKQPDALKKHIADLRRQADSILDPAEKKAAQDRIKFLYDTSGKARGYEEQFSTVREAREFKTLLDSIGGREGIQQMQSTLSNVEQIDQALSAGDASIVQKMWDEAPEGMPKLMPAMMDRFAQAKPQEYEQFIAPRSIRYLDASGFPQAFDRMAALYEAGKTEDAKALREQLVQWVVGNRQSAQQAKQADPEVERLRQQLSQREEAETASKVDTAYNGVLNHAGPAIDKVARPIVGKYGLNPSEYTAFRSAVWDHLQKARNASDTYKTVAPSKQRQGYDKWSDYAKQWTENNAEDSIRAILKTPPWSRIAGAPKPAAATRPVVAAVQQGKEPAPSEIDYSAKGLQAAKKAGFKDLADMLLSGQAPLKTGGVRKWR